MMDWQKNQCAARGIEDWDILAYAIEIGLKVIVG